MYDEGVDAFDEGDFDTLMKNVCAFFLSLVFFFSSGCRWSGEITGRSAGRMQERSFYFWMVDLG